VHQNGRAGRFAGRLEDIVEQGEPARDDLGRGLEIAEYELVALLRDLRRRRDIDDERNPLLLGDLPSAIRRSARARAVSTLVSKSTTTISIGWV
jgi:hypothetical protein